jgi:cytochrome c biogenesis protein CcdA
VLALLSLVVSIGLVDSINPSTIAPALYYATTPRARSTLTGFILGAFVAYFAGGVLVLLGGRELVTSLVPHLSARTTHVVEVGAGVLLLGVAASAWLMRARVADHMGKPHTARARSSFALGAGIMAFELPTAFPYFAAIAAIAASGHSVAAQLALVALYNLLFVLPLVGILAAKTLAGALGERTLQSLRDWTQRNAPAVVAATLAAIGLACLGFGVLALA